VRAYRVQVAEDDAAQGDPALSSGSITGGAP
jgi:hypothetical protein